MKRILAVLVAITSTLGCGREERPAGSASTASTNPSATPAPVAAGDGGASALTVAIGAPARFAVPGSIERPRVEARATEVVPATTPEGKPAVRVTVRALRGDGAGTGVVGWTRREGSPEVEARGKAPSADWTGLVPDGGAVRVAFEGCETAPGVPAGFEYLSAEVRVRVVDAGRVAFEVHGDVVECTR